VYNLLETDLHEGAWRSFGLLQSLTGVPGQRLPAPDQATLPLQGDLCATESSADGFPPLNVSFNFILEYTLSMICVLTQNPSDGL